MREIKFRGKVGANWEYAVMGADNHTEDDANWEHFWYVVDRKTVGQYIGLNDKHDKEVYDGDIVRYISPEEYGLPSTTSIVAVSWEEETAGFDLGHISHRITIYDDIEVLGNVYEHTELLGVKA